MTTITRDTILTDVYEFKYAMHRWTESKFRDKDTLIGGDSMQDGLALFDSTKMYFPNVQSVDMLWLLDFFGYTTEKVDSLLASFNSRPYRINFVGYGGINAAQSYWLSKLYRHVDRYPRQEIHVYDNDTWDPSNMHRNPFFVSPEMHEASKVVTSHKINTLYKYARRIRIHNKKLTPKEMDTTIGLCIGAVDGDTRMALSANPKCCYLQVATNNYVATVIANPKFQVKPTDVYGIIDKSAYTVQTFLITMMMLEWVYDNPDITDECCVEEQDVLVRDVREVNNIKGGEVFGIPTPDIDYIYRTGYRRMENE